MHYSCSLLPVTARPVAALRARVTRTTIVPAVRPLFDRLYAYLNAHQVQPRGLNLLLYRPDPQAPPDGLLMDAAVETIAVLPPDPAVRSAHTPAGRAATTTHWGDYAGLSAAHAALRAWCGGQGLALAGVSWEVYGHWHDDPQQRRTDVFLLVH